LRRKRQVDMWILTGAGWSEECRIYTKFFRSGPTFGSLDLLDLFIFNRLSIFIVY